MGNLLYEMRLYVFICPQTCGRVPIHHHHLQHLGQSGALRSPAFLLRHQGTSQRLRPHPQVLYHQVRHLSLILARSVKMLFTYVYCHLDNLFILK